MRHTISLLGIAVILSGLVASLVGSLLAETTASAPSTTTSAPAATSSAQPPVTVTVTAPDPIPSTADAIAVEVNFQNTSDRDATIVWEKVRSIRVSRGGLLIATYGWGSDKSGWITLKPGEKTARTVSLKIGEDIPALDPGDYAIALDFKIIEAYPAHRELQVPLKITGAVPANSLASGVKNAIDFYRENQRIYGDKSIAAERLSAGLWELTPNMYPGLWQITFTESHTDPYNIIVCINKKTGKAVMPPPIQ